MAAGNRWKSNMRDNFMPPPGTAVHPARGSATTNASILVVDDTATMRDLLATRLRKQGYEVRTASDGPTAIRKAAEHLPDLILLDISMPGMNGYEVCRRLQQDERLREIPVIFLSALSDTIDKVKAFSSGGLDYVTKPFEFEEVVVRIATHLRLRSLQRELTDNSNQLSQSLRELKKLSDLRDNLTHMLVHDLRAPLAGLDCGLDIIQAGAEGKLDHECGELLANAQHVVKRLLDMVCNILDISRMETDKMPLNKRLTDLRALFDEAIHALGSRGNQNQIAFQWPTGPVIAFCDAEIMRRVLTNLVGNAAKFAPDGRITLGARHEPHQTVIEVSDTGIGIPPENLATIFDKFNRSARNVDGPKYSSGLGLAFCKLAVEAHGGKISVTSTVGKGSTFGISLPAPPGNTPATAKTAPE